MEAPRAVPAANGARRYGGPRREWIAAVAVADHGLGSKYERNLPPPILDRKSGALGNEPLLMLGSAAEDDPVEGDASCIVGAVHCHQTKRTKHAVSLAAGD